MVVLGHQGEQGGLDEKQLLQDGKVWIGIFFFLLGGGRGGWGAPSFGLAVLKARALLKAQEC